MPWILTVDMQAVLPGVGDAGAPKINVGSVGPRICPTQVADLQGAFWAHHTQTTPVPWFCLVKGVWSSSFYQGHCGYCPRDRATYPGDALHLLSILQLQGQSDRAPQGPSYHHVGSGSPWSCRERTACYTEGSQQAWGRVSAMISIPIL